MLEEATLAHDQDLAEVTSKINAILAPLVNKHQKGGRRLCLLNPYSPDSVLNFGAAFAIQI